MRNSTKKLIVMSLLVSGAIGIFSSCSGSGTQNSAAGSSSEGSEAQSSASTSDNSESSEKAEISEESSKEESKSDDPDDEKEKGELPAINDPDPSDFGFIDGGILIYQKTAYEQFFGYDGIAKEYAETISDLKKSLGDDVNVYNVVVPTHCGVTLPERFEDKYGFTNQKQYIDTIKSSYTADVIPVDAYDILTHHRDEYLYFNTDHHWTARGAYYAYKQFCKTAGVDYIKLSDMEENKIEGYYGSLTAYADSSNMQEDTVYYYVKDVDTTTTLYNADGTGGEGTTLIHGYASGPYAYGVFLGGDQAFMVCKNNDGNGKKVAVVKESYGNAFCPFIAFTYSETHMIDFRYSEFDFVKYVKDNGITDVIFVNNTMASATPANISALKTLAPSSADEPSEESENVPAEEPEESQEEDFPEANDDGVSFSE